MSSEEKDSLVVRVLSRVLPTLGIVVLAYLLGALSAAHHAWPFSHIERGFDALQAVVHKASLGTPLATRYDSSLWRKARFEGRGVVVHDRERAYPGYTLLTSGHRQGAVLLDMEGEVVHEWEKDFRDIWDDPPHVANPTPPEFIHWAKVHLFENGDLLVVVTSTEDTPRGYALMRLDADSNVIWAHPGNAHHDFHVNDDGTIWTWEAGLRDLSTDPLPGIARQHMLVDQFVVKLSPEGEELSRVSIHEVMAASPFADALFSENVESWDPLHPNQIEPAGAAFASHHDFVEPDDLLLSFRNISAIAVYDPGERKLKWMARGRWKRQHDLDPLPDGTMYLYDNLGGLATPGASEILKYDPGDGSVDWSYAGRPGEPFYSWIRGTQQPLPNGNLLISDCEAGRVIEVTPGGEIVWEYLNPHRATVDGVELVAVLESAVRVGFSPSDFRSEAAPRD